MQKSIIPKISLTTLLLLFGALCLRSENTSCKKICYPQIAEETEALPTEIFPYYPFFAEI
jgi:hypothetical protein